MNNRIIIYYIFFINSIRDLLRAIVQLTVHLVALVMIPELAYLGVVNCLPVIRRF